MTDDIERYRTNLRDELNGAALYAALAAAEADPLRKDLFLQLAQAESNHAKLWREKLAAAAEHRIGTVPLTEPSVVSGLEDPDYIRRMLAMYLPGRDHEAPVQRRVLAVLGELSGTRLETMRDILPLIRERAAA